MKYLISSTNIKTNGKIIKALEMKFRIKFRAQTKTIVRIGIFEDRAILEGVAYIHLSPYILVSYNRL